ncbi:MAG: M28 family peptidase [Phenylobacterium sp.]|uniref:M28 family peptidase n=1 Tax=Phenylobacterium sp. TaxID=1871053 RepID=UPI00391983AE
MRFCHAACAAILVLLAGCAHGEPPALRDLRILAADDMAGRATGTEGAAKARAYLLGRLQALGLEPAHERFEHPFVFEREGRPHTGINLVAKVEGTGRSDRVQVITAHYDHLGVRDGEVFNGADDNASGVAALLAVAEEFKRRPPVHTTVFALLDAEEVGQRGAHSFVAQPPVALARIAINLNLDMVSKSDKGELYVAGGHHFPWMKPRLDRLARRAAVTLRQGHDGPPWQGQDDWTTQSDHFAFHQAGVPWIYLGVEDHPQYHRPTDDFETVPQDFFLRSVATVVAAARLFDSELDAIAREAGR